MAPGGERTTVGVDAVRRHARIRRIRMCARGGDRLATQATRNSYFAFTYGVYGLAP